MHNTQGLSHVVLCAQTPELYESTIHFYQAIGFERLLDQVKTTDDDHHKVWMKLKADMSAQTTDMVVKLILCNSTPGSMPIGPDMANKAHDEENALVILVRDLERARDQLTQCALPCAAVHDRLYARDPIGTPLIFSNRPHGLLRRDPRDADAEEMEQKFQSVCAPRKIAVLTSGGDAPGMNPCVRAVIRYGIAMGCQMFGVYEGYQGLVDGGKQIRRMDWKSVRGWIHIGGTLIGTARCKDFTRREGRLKAAQNLVERGIDSLIVCGGDGSLTGADVFRAEWPGLIDELEKAGSITKESAEQHHHLNIVGLVGSIDNDMAKTDITIGAVTSLHRICECVDAINTTALSHSRAFVVEVMGRHCGWLALMAGIATGADFVFIPERPPPDDWRSDLCAVAQRHRELGKRKTLVIVAEGAIDLSLNPIKADDIKTTLADRLGLDTRVTTLGHVQRGGSPCAADRILATTQGVEAVRAILTAKADTPSSVIGTSDNRVTSTPLMEAVELTHEVAKAIGAKNFARAMELRDPQFAEEYNAFNASTIMDNGTDLILPSHQRLRIGILHVGAPAGGMNAATRTVVRYALGRGHHPIVIYNGFEGLVRGDIEDATWIGVDGWTARGGSELGTNRHVPGEDVDMGMVGYQLQKHRIQALLVIGGFEAYASLVNLEKERKNYPALCIPICQLPATISNNVPGTDFSLGNDTSLNAIVSACDAIAQSARSSRRRVFVVEVQGGKTGYLAVEAGLASGANTVYIPEDGISLSRLQSDVNHLMALYLDDDPDKSEGRIILRTEAVSNTYTTDVISNILKDEGHQFFDSRTAVLGHVQQGDTPSPLDRIRATRLAMHAIRFVEAHTSAALDNAQTNRRPPPIELTTAPESIAVIGIAGNAVKCNPVKDLLVQTDIKNRKPRASWWYDHRDLVDLLAGRGLFTPEAQARIRQDQKEALNLP